mmetsp:Transcript_11572/g.17249  ORF Transcript_11572/g.17249 Transcript_11572/m.17249 type:complete len:696 (-) Transcript_11572:374-2461(-)
MFLLPSSFLLLLLLFWGGYTHQSSGFIFYPTPILSNNKQQKREGAVHHSSPFSGSRHSHQSLLPLHSTSSATSSTTATDEDNEEEADKYFWLANSDMANIENANINNNNANKEHWLMIHAAIQNYKIAVYLSPTNSQYHLYMGKALLIKFHLFPPAPPSSPEEALEEIAQVLEKAVQLEQTNIDSKLNLEREINEDQLSTTLLLLGDVYLQMNKMEQTLRCIDTMHRYSSLKYPFAIEQQHRDQQPLPKFKWIHREQKPATAKMPIAIQTQDDVFDKETIKLIRHAANEHWKNNMNDATSRFSMQYKGNSEVHLHELCEQNPKLKHAIDTALVNKVYPLIRAAFDNDINNGDGDGGGAPNGEICVYDSIVIRYDGDKAREGDSSIMGASQPLHQDFGQFSVNIALNSQHFEKDEENEKGFEGGGTFFVDLINNKGDNEENGSILRPLKAGYAVAHRSTVRHAGAPTRHGVREILVLFLTTRQKPDLQQAPGVERSYRLKLMANKHPSSSVIKECLYMAIEENPADPEPPYLLARELMKPPSPNSNNSIEQRQKDINDGVRYFEIATSLAPFDARVYYNLALALLARYSFTLQYNNKNDQEDESSDFEQTELRNIRNALNAAIHYEKVSREVGCSEGLNIAGALYTLGSNFGRHKSTASIQEAINYLGQIKEFTTDSAMLQEVEFLGEYCRERLES